MGAKHSIVHDVNNCIPPKLWSLMLPCVVKFCHLTIVRHEQGKH